MSLQLYSLAMSTALFLCNMYLPRSFRSTARPRMKLMHLQLAWCRLLVADADADAESIDCINTIQEKHTAVLQICRIVELYSYLLVPGCLGTTAESKV